jgi:hypothetical protein
MKNIIIIIIIVCCANILTAQSKKEIIQKLTLENSNLKNEISVLKNKIQDLEIENSSLKKELTVDKIQTPQEYGKTLFDLFVSQRLIKYPELQYSLIDTIYFTKQTFKEGIDDIKNNAVDFYTNTTNMGIEWSKTKFKRAEFTTVEPDEFRKINKIKGKIYFDYLGDEYYFENNSSILENGKWKGYYFENLVNIELEKKKPYIPYGIVFDRLFYEFNLEQISAKSIYNLKIAIKNNTNYTVDWIKFQFRIFENEELKLSKNIILSEYEFDSKLEPGEKEIILLKDIGEVFIESGVKNDKWSWDIKLLEAKPKPIEE